MCAATNFPYLITPYDAIQNYVHEKEPTTIIQAVFDDFNYAAVNQTAKLMSAWCLRMLTRVKGESR